MKRGTRMLAFLLSVLMLVGLLPFSVFAVTGEQADAPSVEIPEGGTAGDVSDEQLISAVGNENIIFRSDFNKMTESRYGGLKIDVFGGTASHPDTNFNIVNGTKTTMAVVDDGFGGKALQYTKSTDTTQTYIDLINRGVADGDNTFKKLYDTKNKSFVFQADFKYGTGMNSNGLIGAITRVTGGNVTISLVGVTEKGELYPSAQPGNVIGYLNSGVFTTVAVRVVPETNRYYIYINGVNVDENGYQFKSASQITQLSVTKTVDGTEYTTNEKEYILTAVRIYQIGNSTLLKDSDLCIDNVSAYYSDTYLGEREAADGFGELDGKVYRVVNGSRLAASTTGGYVYGTDGAISHYAVKTPAIDFSSVYAGKTGDEIRYLINKGNAPIRNDNLIPGISMWEWAEIKGGADFRFNTLVSDLTGYDAVEFNVYTDGIQQVPTLAIFSNSFVDPSDKKECYWNYNINFGDKTYSEAYKSDGTKATVAIGRNTIAVDGWMSYTVDLGAFTKNRSAKWTDIASLRFCTSGWELDYSFESDGKTRLFNNGTETIFFESINLVKYVPVASVDDILGDTVDGVRILKSGYGWATYGNNTFYYAPWTNEIVKSGTVIDLESGLAYTFDAEGRCLGPANGVITMNGDNYCFIDGVMQKSDVIIGSDTLKIGSDGRIDGIIGKSYAGYTPDAPYVDAPHSTDVEYIYKADFNDLTPGIINSKTGKVKLEDYNKSSDGKNRLSLIMKGNDIIVEDRGNGDMAIGYFNYTPNVDPYSQTWVDDTKTAGKRVVIDYDVKIGSDWNEELNFLQLIGGTTRKFYAILRLNKEGYITLGGKYIARLQSDEYTRVSAVIDVPAKTIDLYINGVKLISAYKFTSEENFTKFGEIRFLQAQMKGQGTIYLDNYYVYVADKPQYVVEGVTLRNGYVTEDDGVTRYYENGVIVLGKFKSAETLIGMEDFLNYNSGKAVYTDNSYLTVFDRGGVAALNVNLPASDISGYEYLEFDLYMSAKAPVDFQINVGQRERLYEVVDYDEATGVGYVTGKYIYSNGGTVIGNKTFKSKDGSVSISGSLRLKDGKYYLRTWVYQSFGYAFDSDELWNNIRKENPEDEGGWVTIQIPISKLSNPVKNEFENLQIAISGWSLNVKRPWNTAGNANYVYPDGSNYTIRYSDVRIVKNESEVFGTVAGSGWNEDKTEYFDPITMTKVTGVYVIDGVYYYFDANGKLVGKCDGIYDTVHYSNESGKWERTAAKRLFKNGEMQFGKISVTDDTFYVADAETGAFNYFGIVAEVDGKFCSFDENGLASLCNGFVDGVYYNNGVKVSGEVRLEDGMYYFENGVPTAIEITKVEDGVRVNYIYGEDGKLVQKTVAAPRDITLTVVRDGKTVTETVLFSSGGTFKYIPRAISGRTYVITDGEGKVIDSDYILIEEVNSSASFTITYTD